MGPGPGPGPRRNLLDRRNLGELAAEPSDGSSSKCLEPGYGKPLKPARRSLLNFCKRLVRLKEKPSNCPPCPPPKPEESFWDYLFKLEERPRPEPSTCRVALRHRDACRKTDPRLCDSRYRRTDGDVLIFTETSRSSCCISREPQPKPPPAYALPKAIVCRRIVEAASSSFPVFAVKEEVEQDPRCCGPRRLRIPFEECRPARKLREPFSCRSGALGTRIAPPMATDRGTCGGRSIGEVLAEATIPQRKTSTEAKIASDSKSEPNVAVRNSSRFQRLQQLTKAANCSGGFGGSVTKPSSPPDKGAQ